MNRINTCKQRQHHRFAPSIQRQLKPLKALNNWRGPLAVAEDFGIIAAAIAAPLLLANISIGLAALVYPVSLILLGSRQRALATVLHEASHKTLTKCKILGRVLGTCFSGWLIFQQFGPYFRSHVKSHHYHLGDLDQDPDFQVVSWFIEMCEHFPLIGNHTEDIYMTRNRLGNKFELFLTGMHAENFHLEHHLNPGIPFWNLKRARQIRLRDPEYAELDRNYGGIFTRGPIGAAPALSQLIDSVDQQHKKEIIEGGKTWKENRYRS